MEAERAPEPSPSSVTEGNIITSHKHVRKRFALYWKMKYEMIREIVHEESKKTIKLDEYLVCCQITRGNQKKR